jgi:hypothetical protein
MKEKSLLYSLLFHILLLSMLLVNFKILKKPKKLNHQSFSVSIGTKQKPIQKDMMSIKEGVPKKIIPKPEPKKKEVVKKEEVIKEKEILKKKKIEKVEEKKVPIKKLAPKKHAQKNAEPKKDKDIFTKSLQESGNEKIANLAENEMSSIKKQLAQHWIKTPCIDDMVVELELVINSNCLILSRKIDMVKYMHSSRAIACANSALRAAQKFEKLNLPLNKCKEIHGELMLLKFSANN